MPSASPHLSYTADLKGRGRTERTPPRVRRRNKKKKGKGGRGGGLHRACSHVHDRGDEEKNRRKLKKTQSLSTKKKRRKGGKKKQVARLRDQVNVGDKREEGEKAPDRGEKEKATTSTRSKDGRG